MSSVNPLEDHINDTVFFEELSNYARIHEHDFTTIRVEEKPSLICATCGLLYCETCGKSAKEMTSDVIDSL
jgi:hypothetical protein